MSSDPKIAKRKATRKKTFDVEEGKNAERKDDVKQSKREEERM